MLSLESPEEQGKTKLRVSWLVKTQPAVLPARGAAAAHAAHSRPMPLHNAQESSDKSIKAVTRDS